MQFSSIYDAYKKKVERKGRTQEELNQVIYWLTGDDEASLSEKFKTNLTVREYVEQFPRLQSDASRIKGKICGVQIEEIQDEVMKRIRYLDKLVDELAKGWDLQKIFHRK
ncbi:DUF2200 family protein [Streptococcus pneumoniae]